MVVRVVACPSNLFFRETPQLWRKLLVRSEEVDGLLAQFVPAGVEFTRTRVHEVVLDGWQGSSFFQLLSATSRLSSVPALTVGISRFLSIAQYLARLHSNPVKSRPL